MERLAISPRRYHQVTLAALAGLAVIVVTGAAVRLTGSGLGCPEWPTCQGGQVVAEGEYHAMVEFVNRTITGLVSVAVMLAVLGSLFRQPRRRDLVWLSLGLVGGVLAQIVLGGLVVRYHLPPPLVMGHFLVSMVLLLNATVLHHRAGQPDHGQWRPAVSSHHLVVGRLSVVTAALALFLGTVVTGSGPHAGSSGEVVVERLPFDIGDVARLHGLAVVVFGGFTIYLLRSLRSAGAPAAVLRRGHLLLAVLVAQAAVGYTQYFTGVPAVLVGVHVVGAVAVWVCTVRLVLAMGNRVAAGEPALAGRAPKPAA